MTQKFLYSRENRKEDTIISLGNLRIGQDLVFMAGPCSVEDNLDLMISIAKKVKDSGAKVFRAGAFKPRSSPYSFQGLGERGLKILNKVREETGLLIITEVMDTRDVDIVSKYSDIIQIGARNMQNFSLLKEVGKQNKPVLLKRGLSATLDEFLMSAEYIMKEGNTNVILCERGIRTFVDYTRNTLDLSIVPALKEKTHLPIVIDPSHATGYRSYVKSMSLASVAAGCDGLLLEVHINPDKAASDSKQTIDPEVFENIVNKSLSIKKIL